MSYDVSLCSVVNTFTDGNIHLNLLSKKVVPPRLPNYCRLLVRFPQQQYWRIDFSCKVFQSPCCMFALAALIKHRGQRCDLAYLHDTLPINFWYILLPSAIHCYENGNQFTLLTTCKLYLLLRLSQYFLFSHIFWWNEICPLNP